MHIIQCRLFKLDNFSSEIAAKPCCHLTNTNDGGFAFCQITLVSGIIITIIKLMTPAAVLMQ